MKRTSGDLKAAARKIAPVTDADDVEPVSSLLRMLSSDPAMASILISLSAGELGAEALAQAVGLDRAEVGRRLAALSEFGLSIARENEDEGRSLYSLTAKGRYVVRFLESMISWERRPSESHAEIDPALLERLGEILVDPEEWFHTPNTVFEGRRPLDLLGTPDEPRLRNQIEAARQGMFS
jgi:DNA-binding HxlR family transcriptional regulator